MTIHKQSANKFYVNNTEDEPEKQKKADLYCELSSATDKLLPQEVDLKSPSLD